jgi:hypothetical protein
VQCQTRPRLRLFLHLGLASVVVGAEKMEGDVRLVSDDPAIVGIWWDVKELAGVQWDNAAVIERSGGGARENQTDVLDVTMGRAECGANVL